jgi:ubiquinone/menaquinone biosynthesis C-methylase UbiE
VLDHACGAGVDVLLAARRVGARGKVIGVDMTPPMRDRATADHSRLSSAAGARRRLASIHAIPLTTSRKKNKHASWQRVCKEV